MKILIINTNRFDRNGMSTFVMNYAKAFVKFGTSVDVLVNGFIEQDFNNLLVELGINVYNFGNRNRQPLKYVRKLRELIRKEEYDIVYVQGNSATLAIEAFAVNPFRNQLKVAMHAHGVTTSHPFINSLLKQYFLNHFDIALAASQAAGEFLFDGRSFDVVKNGINVDEFGYSNINRENVRNALKLAPNQKLIVQLGALTPQKNYPFTLDIAESFLNDNSTYFALFGDGPEYNQISQEIANRQLTNIGLFKPVKDVSAVLSAADGVIFPSRFEPFGLVALEAQSVGTMLAVSNVFVRELDITPAISYLDLNVQAWHEWIDDLSVGNRYDSALTQKLIVEAQFDMDTNATKLLHVFESYLLK